MVILIYKSHNPPDPEEKKHDFMQNIKESGKMFRDGKEHDWKASGKGII
jgi:hypothetical protein